LRQPARLFPSSEVRVRIAPDLIRIPDVAVFAGKEPVGVPADLPLIVLEIVSPDDRWHEIIAKLREFHDWGVPNVWLVDPEAKSLFVLNAKLNQVDAFTLPEYGIRIGPDDLFT
jgi:Uma2 family endonuclease